MKALMDADFDSAVSKDVVLVDFWATWCGPCKRLMPQLDELSTTFAGKVEFYKVDCDANPETPSAHGIRGVPTVLIFKDGVKVDQIVGLNDKSVYENALNKHLA